MKKYRNTEQFRFQEEKNFIEKVSNMFIGVDYSKVVYTNNITPVELICEKHGSFFIRPCDHKKGFSCKKCKHSEKYNTDTFISKATEIHGNKYNYSGVNYTDCRLKINLYCNTCNLWFKQTAENHIKGHGCKVCGGKRGGSGFTLNGWQKMQKGRKAKIYFLKIYDDNEYFYKIGITFQSIENRNKQLPYKYEIVSVKEYDDCSIPFVLEKRFKRLYNKYKYIPKKIMQGYTECYKKT